MAGNSRIKLPQDLCEHSSIFNELMSYPNVIDCLNDSQRKSLERLLPTFPEGSNTAAETEKSLRMLFTKETQR